MTARSSPRCPASGVTITAASGIPVGGGVIIDCPTCGRPVRLRGDAASTIPTIPHHGSVQTRNTRAADERLREHRRFGIR